jgi:hypothetical protein
MLLHGLYLQSGNGFVSDVEVEGPGVPTATGRCPEAVRA